MKVALASTAWVVACGPLLGLDDLEFNRRPGDGAGGRCSSGACGGRGGEGSDGAANEGGNGGSPSGGGEGGNSANANGDGGDPAGGPASSDGADGEAGQNPGGSAGTGSGGPAVIGCALCPGGDLTGAGGPARSVRACHGGDLSCAPSCTERYCGSPPWPSEAPYRIIQSAEALSFSSDDELRIRVVAGAWSQGELFRFVTCEDDCSDRGRWLEIRPGVANQGIIVPSATGAQTMTLKPGANNVTIAHALGHAIGLPHTFNRADRDRYVRFEEEAWCASPEAAESLFKCGLLPQPDAAFPPVPSGTFGVYDERSVMNCGAGSVCGNSDGPSPSEYPTDSDISAAVELVGIGAAWAPFTPIAEDGLAGPLGPRSYEPVPGVGIVGDPAICSTEYPNLELFIRGSNGHLYRKSRNAPGGVFGGWSDWLDVGGGFDSDPACVAWPERIDLIARRADGNIYLGTHSGGAWSEWTSIGAPTGGASDPAIASWQPDRLDVFVRGLDDDLLYQRTFDGDWSNWAQPAAASLAFASKPSAVSWGSNRIDVTVRGKDNQIWYLTYAGTWLAPGYFQKQVRGAVAISSWEPNRLDLFARGQDDKLWHIAWTGSGWTNFFSLAVGLVGSPAAIAKGPPGGHLDVFAPFDDDGQRGVWWKYWPYTHPCIVALPLSCGPCDE